MLLLCGLATAHVSALVYGPTASFEEVELTRFGDTVTVWTEAQWRAASASDFAAFNVIIVGDLACGGPSGSDYDALYDTRSTWQPAIRGAVAIHGLALGCSGGTAASKFLYNAVLWAGAARHPGMVVAADPGLRDLDFMDAWGSFTTSSSGGDAVVVQESGHVTMSGLTSATLSGWGDSVLATLPSYPSGWTLVADDGAEAVVIGFPSCDRDFDGHEDEDRCGGDDCDDGDWYVFPAATETCDGVDTDCNGAVDDDPVDGVSAWVDADGDGYGEGAELVKCSIEAGYADNEEDCDDGDGALNPDTAWYADADADGYGDPAAVTRTCTAPAGTVREATDCDDADGGAWPGAAEVAYDGVDQDCDGADACDLDLDGGEATACGGDDCDDADASIFAGAVDVVYDGVDQDCDGASDYDADRDGDDAVAFGGGDCDDALATVYRGAPEVPDGLDNDCNGYAEDDDDDGDGLSSEDELALGLDPADPDADDDGLADGREVGPDTDGDGLGDESDPDDDGDGLPTLDEIGSYDWRDAGTQPPDTDGDGTIDAHDDDSDGDGWLDAEEGLVDTDADGVGDWLDADSDGDGLFDADELLDTDADGTADRLDGDDDDDGIPSSVEGAGDGDDDGTIDALDLDSDDDGWPDAEEGTADTDADGEGDWRDEDSDGDGTDDHEEPGDTDGDGVLDRVSADDDGDGLPSATEGDGDPDADGAANRHDLDSDGDTFPDAEEAPAGAATLDSNADGTPDRLDSDSEGDTVMDAEEAHGDTDGDGLSDRLDPDDDGDGLLSVIEGLVDTDGDGLADCVDPDSDGDGASDADEGLADVDCDGVTNSVDGDDDDGPCAPPAEILDPWADSAAPADADPSRPPPVEGGCGGGFAFVLCFPLLWRRFR